MDGFQQPHQHHHTQSQHGQQQHQQQQQAWLLDYQYYQNNVNSRNLSLNMSSLPIANPLSPVGGGPGQGSPFSFEAPAHAHVHTSGQASPINPTGARHFDDHGHTIPNTAFDIKRGTPQSSRPPSNAGHATASTSPTVSSASHLPRKRSFTAHPNISSASINSPIAPASGGGGSSLNSSSNAHSVSPSPSTTMSVVSGLGLSSGVNVNISTPLVEVDAEHEADDGYDDDSIDMTDSGAGASGSASTSTGGGGGNSPVEGSTSGAEETYMGANQSTGSAVGGMGASMGVIGKPMATNNFVTKLYQMINDTKSGQFISWTELGTSFVVSNVGEFSRSILGSHFKHNNFSSFVRQLNMYGFHKINRTPRAQRTSTDAQTWEFSHHKFLRGRPDLLDEIKRKALEPDPAIKHRIELPGELAAQLNLMKDEVRRCNSELTVERRKVDQLTKALCQLWDSVGKSLPVPPIPLDLLDSSESPNIYVTSPTSSNAPRFAPPPLSMNSMNLHTIHGLNSPTSSPTTNDFPFSHAPHVAHHGHPQGGHAPHPLSRQHSFHHQQNGIAISGRNDRSSASSTPLLSSPSPGSLSTSISMDMDLYDDGSCDPPPVSGREGAKRQRLDDSLDGTPGLGLSMVNVNGHGHGPGSSGSSESNIGLLSSVSSPGAGPCGPGLNSLTVTKKNSMRARSDSAPLGYMSSGGGLGLHSPWGHTHGLNSGHPLGAGPGMNGQSIAGRPRSGSGMMPPRIAIPSINIGGVNRGPLGSSGPSTPMLGMPHPHGHVGGGR